MPNLYSIDVTIHATAYIMADSKEEAFQALNDRKDTGFELPTTSNDLDMPINGETFHAEMPEFSLSPAMTFVGAETSVVMEIVAEFDEEAKED